MRKIYSFAHFPLLLLLGISATLYFSFTAEDAYITYRYAENWANTGSLVYNNGEQINAMTSPLHTVLSSALFVVTGDTALSNKILSFILVSLSVFLVWYRFKESVHLQLLTFILFLAPCLMLWTFGGLETPILLFLATTTTILALRPHPFPLHLVCVLFFLAGLAFLTRYDSILFFLPVTLYAASKARSFKHVLIALAVSMIFPLAWLFVSIEYYGDLLPTSFYVKTPTGNLSSLIFNAKYIGFYLLVIGIIPVVTLIFVLLVQKARTIHTLYQHFKSVWWLYVGLGLEIVYGLTMATHHMMFSFRFFVPYLPATVLLVVELLAGASETSKIDLTTGRPAYLFTGLLLGLTLFQLYQNSYTYNHSINGISPIGEYRAIGVQDYVKFIQILQQEAFDIEKHWESIHGDRGRPPRILTFAAGMLPYTYRESYIYEKLVSYRHCHERYQQALYADYVHILAPRQGEIQQQLPRPEETFRLVSSYEMVFDGSMQKFLVYYNPQPQAHNLTARIYELCAQSVHSEN